MTLDIERIGLLDRVASADDLHDQTINVNLDVEETLPESSSRGTSRAGQRRLRTETQSQKNISNLGAVERNSINGNDEFAQIFIKYGNNPDGIPALLYAIKLKDIKAVKLMLENGASPDTRVRQERGIRYNDNNLPSNAIEYASAYSSPEMIALLESYGADIRNKTEFRKEENQNILVQSPISIAVAFDNTEVVRYLVSRGVNIHKSNVLSYEYGLPIVIAAQNNSMKVFKYLISVGVKVPEIKDLLLSISLSEKGTDVFRFLLDNYGPFSSQVLDGLLPCAIYKNDLELLKFMIKKGANPVSGMYLIYQDSKQYPAKYSIIEFLLSSGVDTKKPFNGRTLIDSAASIGDVTLVKLLLKYGAELSPQFVANPLQNSNVYRFPEMVKFLIDSGVPVNKAYDGGMTPLHYASQLNDPNAGASIELLIVAGANIHAVNRSGSTPLHVARNDSVIIKLIQKGANIHALDVNKSKPYHAKGDMSLEAIKAFVQKGANFNEITGNCPAFYYFTWRDDAKEVLGFLIANNKLNINIKNTHDGRTVFHNAVQGGKIDLMEFLIKNKADINAKDSQGKTPLAIAKEFHQELVPWLIDHGANWNPN